MAAVIALVSGCAATGPSYTSVKSTLPQLKADKARLYFLREGSFMGSGVTARVHLNGTKIADLNMDGFAYADSPAGNVLIMIDAPLNFGEARQSFNIENGKTYYFFVANNTSYVMAGSFGGIIGAVLAGGGPFAFYRIPEAKSKADVKKVKTLFLIKYRK